VRERVINHGRRSLLGDNPDVGRGSLVSVAASLDSNETTHNVAVHLKKRLCDISGDIVNASSTHTSRDCRSIHVEVYCSRRARPKRA